MSELEHSILGAVLVDNSYWEDVQELRGHLVYPYHPIVEAMQCLNVRGLPIDLVSLKNQLVTTGNVEASGGIAFVASLIDGLHPLSKETVKGWAAQIKMASKLRRLAQEAEKLVAATKDPTRSLESIVGQFQAAAFDSDPGGIQGRSFTPYDLRKATEAEWDRLASPDGMAGYSYGIPALDQLTSGIQVGQSIIIGARPGVGKSSLALQIADRVACAGHTVSFFSMEMEAGQLSMIRACAKAKVTRGQVAVLPPTHDYMKDFLKAIHEQAETPLFVDQPGTNTLAAIKARASRIKAEHGLGLIVIDYLQLMSGDNGRGATRNDELTVISRGIKQMARELGCAVITCAQLNRQASGPAAEPHLGHLRDSGAIEADADVVLLLKPIAEVTNPANRTAPIQVDALVEKNRTGARGVVELTFVGKYQTFIPRDTFDEDGEYL